MSPTRSQIEAARLLIKMLEEDGEPVDPRLRGLAKLQADDEVESGANVRHAWLFRAMNRPRIKPLVPDAAYYRLLDRFSDNDGWRPLSIREGRR